jgi:tRNA pseudouridine55 synthase
MNCLILINKPKGITSFSALSEIKKKMPRIRVGHTGTLDKFAQGLLLVLTGGYTRLTNFFLQLPKSYRAIIYLGKETSTLDPEGEITAEGNLPEYESIIVALNDFKGHMLQVPPQYSALHIKGKRAYQYALKGEKAELKARPITIFNNKLVDYKPPFLTVEISCSTGTYIRAVARDLAYKLNTYAHVWELSRLEIGPFHLSAAVTLKQFDPCLHLVGAVDFIKKIAGLGYLTVQDQYQELIFNGVGLKDFYFQETEITPGLYAIFTVKDKLIAVVKKTEGNYRYHLVVRE